MSKEWYDTKKWKVGDKYWIYHCHGCKKYWGEIIDILPSGDHIVRWEDGLVTDEGRKPEPASDYFER